MLFPLIVGFVQPVVPVGVTTGFRPYFSTKRCNMAAISARVAVPFGSRRLFSLPPIMQETTVTITEEMTEETTEKITEETQTRTEEPGENEQSAVCSGRYGSADFL